MAGGRGVMDEALEDGELSGSDSEMVAVQAPFALHGSSSAVSGYRSSGRPAESSDSDPDSSDDEAALWRRKRQKVSNRPCPPRGGPAPLPPAGTPGGRKVNNIWGSVVQEQCQDSLTAELGVFGMEGVGMSGRDVETYNFVLARKMMEKEREIERQQRSGAEVSMLDAELDQYMKDRGQGDGKRKRAAKDRLGPRAEMDIKGRFEITEDDPEDMVVDEIAHRLQEPKRDLIQRAVSVVGKKKAIELLGETATLEENGGVYTMDGSRRRTPGGVFLNLMKNTPSITKAQIRHIFYDEQQKDVKTKKAAQKRRRQVVAKKMKQAIGTLNLQEHDDVSRETFASDTNEALESLEEAAAGDEPAAAGDEPAAAGDEPAAAGDEPAAAGEAAVGTEETPVIYSPADLEVF